MRSRLLAACVMGAWILGSMALLLIFRGVPLRVRGALILASLLVLIIGLGWLQMTRRK